VAEREHSFPACKPEYILVPNTGERAEAIVMDRAAAPGSPLFAGRRNVIGKVPPSVGLTAVLIGNAVPTHQRPRRSCLPRHLRYLRIAGKCGDVPPDIARRLGSQGARTFVRRRVPERMKPGVRASPVARQRKSGSSLGTLKNGSGQTDIFTRIGGPRPTCGSPAPRSSCGQGLTRPRRA
jgi:hypothetical protein